MFSGLRLGSTLYILDKENTPALQIGTVTGVSSPLTYTTFPQSTTDITVKVGTSTFEFKQLPGNSGIVNYNNGKTVISDSLELMSREVEMTLKLSQEIIDNIEYHKLTVSACEEMLKLLNPLFAKLKELETKINSLETKVGSMESKLDNITSMLTKVLDK